MNRRKQYWIVILVLLAGCGHETVSEIPYFSLEDMTPEWESSQTVSESEYRHVQSFIFTDQSGESVSEEDVAGQPYVASFFFVSCTNICPTLKTRLTSVAASFDADELKILSHSVTPDLDTVERLAAYSRINNIDERQWKLLTDSKEDVLRHAADSFGAQLKNYTAGVSGEEDFLHTETVFLVDGEGFVRGLYNGTLQLEIEQLIKDIDVLLLESKAAS